MSTLRRLVPEAERILDALPPLPSPFSVSAFIALVAEHRGRPIELVRMSAGDRDLPCGLWLPLDDMDVIVVAQEASGILEEQIILHEIAHMLWDHSTKVDTATLGLLLGSLGSGLVEERMAATEHLRMAARTSFGPKPEKQAEVLATVIAERAVDRDASSSDVPPGIATALTHPVRRAK